MKPRAARSPSAGSRVLPSARCQTDRGYACNRPSPHATAELALASHTREIAVGVRLLEVTHPLHALREALGAAGVLVTFASPRGGAIPIDPYSDPRNPQGISGTDDVSRHFLADEAQLAAFNASRRAADVHARDFDALLVAGGNGAVYDLGSDASVAALVQGFVDEDKIVAALCHGVAALLGVHKANSTEPLVAHERVTAFSNAEEALAQAQIGSTDYLPFLLQDELTKKGAAYEQTAPFQPLALTACGGLLITGQQNFSGALVGGALVRELGAQRTRHLRFAADRAVVAERIRGTWVSRAVERVAKPDGRVLWRRRTFDIGAERFRVLVDIFASAAGAEAEDAAARVFTMEFEGAYTIGDAAPQVPLAAGGAAFQSQWGHSRWWMTPQAATFVERALRADPRTAGIPWELGVPVDVSEYGAIDVPSVRHGPCEYDIVAVHVADAAAGDVLAFGEAPDTPPVRLSTRPARLGGDVFVRVAASGDDYDARRARSIHASPSLTRTIAVLGAGSVGGTLGRLFAQAGHRVVFGSRDAQKPAVVEVVAAAVRAAGGIGSARASDVASAVRDAQVVVVALPWAAVESTLGELDLAGKVVVDATNPIGAGMTLTHAHTTSGAEQVERVARARGAAAVLKCFNTVGADHFSQPLTADGLRKSLFVCGAAGEAKQWLLRVVREQLGFDAVDAGPLDMARLTEPLALLWIAYAHRLGNGRAHAFKLARAPPAEPALELLSDLRSVAENPPEGVSASPQSEHDIFKWSATIVGPADTPWEGGIFSLLLQFPSDYPQRPPRVRFVCEMFHPNVYPDGTLCLDIIQDKWSPVYTVSSILTSIQSLLTDPNASSPANAEAASMWSTDRAEYNKRVRRIAARSVE